MKKLFVYGTLRNPDIQKEAFGRVAQFQKDVLKGFAKSTIEIKGITYPILKKGDEEIEGLVLDITEKELKDIDVFETKNYRRIEVELKSGNRAWVYVK